MSVYTKSFRPLNKEYYVFPWLLKGLCGRPQRRKEGIGSVHRSSYMYTSSLALHSQDELDVVSKFGYLDNTIYASQIHTTMSMCGGLERALLNFQETILTAYLSRVLISSAMYYFS